MAETIKISRKARIEKIATELFREKGYSATSMRNLADHIGIEAASLYSHIKSKEEILQNICFRIAREFFLAVDMVSSAGSASEKLREMIIGHIRVITKDPASTAVFANEWKHLSEPHLSDFLKMRHIYELKYTEVIDAGKLSGEFEDIDTRLAVLTILSGINSMQNWYKPDGKLSATEIAEQLSVLALNGIKKTNYTTSKL
jgi:TetR/AcrR family transcriptional regulator, cholesterol catabolism regulator